MREFTGYLLRDLRALRPISGAVLPGIAFCWAAVLFAVPPRPHPARFVNDGANLLTAEESGALESKLAAFDRETSTQIVIVTIPTLDGRPLEEYSIQLAETWGIGQKGKDNGLLILIPVRERKIRIEVGYGLEGALPDAYARRIIDGTLGPNFKNARYYAGLDQATDQIIGLTRGEYDASDIRPVTSFSDDDLIIGRIFVYLFGGIFALFALFAGLSAAGTNRLPGLGIGLTMIAWAAYTEYDYWPHYQNAYFWLRLILPPIVLFAGFLWYFIARGVAATRHAALLKRVRNDKTWDRMLRRYDAPAVLRERDALAEEIAATKPRRNTIHQLETKLSGYLLGPDKFFRRRNDADLIDLEERIEKAGLLTTPAHPEAAREETAAFLRKERQYFKARKLDELDSADESRLAAARERLRELLADPAAVLGVESAWVLNAAREFMDGETGKNEWRRLRSEYTAASITGAQKSFRARFDAALALQAGAERDAALADFYRNCIETLRVKPGEYLSKIVSRANSRSSSSSSGAFSGSSSFSSGGSSSSFGGGSFGGGGASGSW